jgi:lysophospholipase L1-like esterase
VVDYVSLGDSFAAGTGVGNYVNGNPVDPEYGRRCYRSVANYSVQLAAFVANQTGIATHRVDRACHGATIPEVLAHQLSALNFDTDLATLSIGGNDLGFWRASQIPDRGPNKVPVWNGGWECRNGAGSSRPSSRTRR